MRISAYLLLAVVLGSGVLALAAAWGWSSGGWLTTRFGFHDAMAVGALHGVAGFFTLGVLLNLGPRLGRYDALGRARAFRPHSTSLAIVGMLLVFAGFFGFYAAGLAIQSTTFPGWLNIYLSPTTLGTVAMSITFGLAGGLTGGWFASRGDPLWTMSGGLAGIVTVSAGADVYHPSLSYLLGATGGVLAVWVGRLVGEAAAGRRRRARRRRPRLLRLLRRPPRRHRRGRLSDRAEQHPGVLRRPAPGRPHVRSRSPSSRATS